MIRRLVVLGALQLACALPASAQQDGASGIVFWTEFSALAIGSTHHLLAKTDLRPGDTVRLAWRDAAGVRQKSNGRLSTIGDDSLTFTTDGVEHRVARADLLDGQVYRGRERLWAQGFASVTPRIERRQLGAAARITF